MNRRRLTVPTDSESAPRAIPGVRAPVRAPGRAYTLAQVLEIVIEAAGLSLGYEVVMGLTGLAYRTPPWPDDPQAERDEEPQAVAALSASLGQAITVIDRREELAPPAVLEHVRDRVGRGLPCAARGWGSAKDHWSVICGYIAGEGRLLGHCLLDAPRDQYESWPAEVELLALLDRSPTPSGPEAIEKSLSEGSGGIATEGPVRYKSWLIELQELDEAPPESHEDAVELLADARAAAAAFAEGVALHVGELRAAWLNEAAILWREMVEVLEARGLPHAPEAIHRLDSPEGRAAWCDAIRRAAALDYRAARAVKCSSTVDYLPEDAAPD